VDYDVTYKVDNFKGSFVN